MEADAFDGAILDDHRYADPTFAAAVVLLEEAASALNKCTEPLLEVLDADRRYCRPLRPT